MQKPVLFAAVGFLLLGHIYSAAITRTSETTINQSPEQPTQDVPETKTTGSDVEVEAQEITTTPPAVIPCHHANENELQVDSTNPILGDMPIYQDNHIFDIINRNHVPLRNCKEILDYGSFNKSGLYVVQPGNGGEFVVFCDMTLLGGGWTIVQRRLNSKLSFDRSYSSYRNGFGDFTENFWLGLDKISRLTQPENADGPMEIYIGVEAFFDSSSFARYSEFSVGSETSGYKLKISGYDTSSKAGDSMSFSNGQKFSTHDKDQDTQKSYHCRRSFSGYNGGWWFRDCVYTNLNGQYFKDGPNKVNGISWSTWLGSRYSLKTAVMAVRPAQ